MSSMPSPPTCGNADIDDAREHVWGITLWVINECTRIPENPTVENHDVIVYQIPPTCVDDVTPAKP